MMPIGFLPITEDEHLPYIGDLSATKRSFQRLWSDFWVAKSHKPSVLAKGSQSVSQSRLNLGFIRAAACKCV